MKSRRAPRFQIKQFEDALKKVPKKERERALKWLKENYGITPKQLIKFWNRSK